MPAAPYAVPLETTLPGASRRRVWAHPDLASHSLLVLTFDRIYLAPLAGPPKPEVLAAVEAGGDLDALLGPLAVVIDLAGVTRLNLDLVTNSLVVEYVGGGLGTSRARLTFATPEAADACFTKAWRRLGDGVRLTPYRRDVWSLARGPLLLLAGALLATAALVLLLSVSEDTTGAGGVLGGLNWKAVCGLGGAVAAASQVWLYRRLTAPPAALELVRG
jgi:hypothetical protein